MKVLITEDTLDSLLSIKISSDGGKTYTDYSVSSLKNGVTFDCSPNNLKVICDANVLKYIQVLADGEKSTSNVDLSDYLKIKDVYIDVYKNPYYGKDLTKEEVDNLSVNDTNFYTFRKHAYYCSSKNFDIYTLTYTSLVPSKDDSIHYISSEFFDCSTTVDSETIFFICYFSNLPEILDDFYYVYFYFESDDYHAVFRTNVRIHFIKHF